MLKSQREFIDMKRGILYPFSQRKSARLIYDMFPDVLHNVTLSAIYARIRRYDKARKTTDAPATKAVSA